MPKKLLHTLKENWDFVTNKFATSCNYLTFTTIVGYIYNYFLHLKPLATTLRLTYDKWIFSSFHLDNFQYNFHPRRPLYLPLVANVTKWIIALWVFQMYYTYLGIRGPQLCIGCILLIIMWVHTKMYPYITGYV